MMTVIMKVIITILIMIIMITIIVIITTMTSTLRQHRIISVFLLFQPVTGKLEQLYVPFVEHILGNG